MTKHDALRLLEETLEVPPHSLTGEEKLWDLDGWDSLSTMAFIAKVDKRWGLVVPGGKVATCRTVNDLLRLLGASAVERAA